MVASFVRLELTLRVRVGVVRELDHDSDDRVRSSARYVHHRSLTFVHAGNSSIHRQRLFVVVHERSSGLGSRLGSEQSQQMLSFSRRGGGITSLEERQLLRET